MNNSELQDFRDRCLRALVNGHKIALADVYIETLAPECGSLSGIVPEGMSKGSAEHLFAMANEVLSNRARGVTAEIPLSSSKAARESVRRSSPKKKSSSSSKR